MHGREQRGSFAQNRLAMHPTVLRLAQEYKLRLLGLYGDDFVELVLFGSYARNEQHEESDVDFSVMLRNITRPSAEIFNTAPISSELSLKYGLPVSQQKKDTSMQGVYQNIRAEGIVV